MPATTSIGTGIRTLRDRDACSFFTLQAWLVTLRLLLACALLVHSPISTFATVGQDGGPWPAYLPADSIPAGSPVRENQRLVASGLALFLGPFGAHRLYLGTTPKVAVVYGVTFGGFGVLPLIDLGHLLFSKDLGAYMNNDRVFMWNRADGAPAPTPP